MPPAPPTDIPGTATTEAPIRIGVSSCLLGEQVRYDGGHKHDRWITGMLGNFVTFVPVCPELEVGLGVPRPTIRLQTDTEDGAHRLVEPRAGTDLTDRMDKWSRRRVTRLAREDLSGYILKKGSPSCGMERVKVHRTTGHSRMDGVGVYARALMERFPLLPVEEEGRLNDARLRENFIERVFAWRRVQDLFTGRWRRGDVVRFHTDEKMLLLAHDPEGYRALGRLVARIKQMPPAEFRDAYIEGYMTTLRHLATTRRHMNTLQHMVGHLRDHLDDDERTELHEVLGDYARGLVPLVVPVTLVRHHVRRHGVAYLAGQRYLAPSPKELMLRNHT